MTSSKKTRIAQTGLIAVLAVTHLAALAGECKVGRTENLLAEGGRSQTVWLSEARNTWDDWIWRGREYELRCPRSGTINCQQQFNFTRSTAYQWEVGADFKPGSLPVIGSALKFIGISGSYGQTRTYSMSVARTITLQPGWGAYPIQVIVRRWTSGDFRGAWRRDPNAKCSRDLAAPNRPNWYNWDANVRFGSWATNREVSRYDSWHTFRI